MSLLLDTHAFLWSVSNPSRLSAAARGAIADRDNRVVVSSASAWEIAIKHRLGRFPEATRLLDRLHDVLRAAGFESLAISVEHAVAAGLLPGNHKDPFDRMLIAQAQIEGFTLVTAGSIFRDYEVAICW